MAGTSSGTTPKVGSRAVPLDEVTVPDSPPQAKPHYNHQQKRDKGSRWVAKEGGFRSNSPLKQGGTAEVVKQVEAHRIEDDEKTLKRATAASTSYARTTTPPRRHRHGGYSSDEVLTPADKENTCAISGLASALFALVFSVLLFLGTVQL